MTVEHFPLHLKYRPGTLAGLIGNEATVRSIQSVLNRPAKPHAFLLTGPSGTGKTTLARIIANAMGCSDRDFYQKNSADYRGIDAARDLISAAVRRPWVGKVAVYLLDECHQLTKDAQNALLKLLEEPPAHAYFILATTDPDKLLPAIRTRCTSFPLSPLAPRIILDRLMYVCEAEDCPEDHPTTAVLTEIARVCHGSLRKALMILDQVIDIEDEKEALDSLEDASGEDFQVLELCRALMKGQRWSFLQQVLKGIDAEPESVRYAVLGYFTTVMLNDDTEKAVKIAKHFLPSVMYSGKAGLAIACFEASKENRPIKV